MRPLLDIVTTVCIGLLIGTEFAVAVFINPILRKLGAREVTSIMEQLEAFGWLFRHPPPRHGALPVWKINPAVHVQFAEQAKEEAARRTRDRATIIKDATARGVDK